MAALHPTAFDLDDDFAPLVFGLVETQQAVHAAIRALAVAFLQRAGWVRVAAADMEGTADFRLWAEGRCGMYAAWRRLNELEKA